VYEILANKHGGQSMRGKKRIQPGYHASRGWFYKPIQKVICKWDPIFGREVTQATFHEVRRVMEDGSGTLVVNIENTKHRRFVCELLKALDELHDPENSHGWVVKMWPRRNYGPNRRLLPTYAEIKEQIRELGGPKFTVDALKRSATRLRMLVSEKQKELDEQSAHSEANLSRVA
jgi:hypothetical protein